MNKTMVNQGLGMMLYVVWMIINYGMAYRNTFCKIDASLNDMVCEANHIVFERSLVSKFTCAGVCHHDTSCTGFVFGESGATCIGCNATPAVSSTGGTQYCHVTRSYGTTCFDNDACYGENQQCTDNFCICQAGYSFRRSIWACVESCPAYGNTFQVYYDHVMAGYDYSGLTGDLETCMQACIVNDTCRSIDYHPFYKNCDLQAVTVLNHPSAYGNFKHYDHYHRNCVD